MYYNEIRDIHMKNGEFFHFELDGDMSRSIDYSNMDREIIVISKDKTKRDFNIEFGDIKKKKEIKTIEELRKTFEELILHMRQIFSQYVWDTSTQLHKIPQYSQKFDDFTNIKKEDIEFLKNQLVFDLLLEKYRSNDSNQEAMTLNEYCENHFYHYDNYDDTWVKPTGVKFDDDKKDAKQRAVNIMERQIDLEIRFMERENLVVEDANFKLENDESIRHYKSLKANAKIHKYFWNCLFLKANPEMIVSHQIRRNFVIEYDDDDHYIDDYGIFAKNLNIYDKYVETVMTERRPDDLDVNEDYFNKSMYFYDLESIYRVEFMYKLAEILKEKGLINADKIRSLIGNTILPENSYTVVSCPYIVEHEGTKLLGFEQRANIYLPITLAGKSYKRILHDILENTGDYSFLDDCLANIYVIRVDVLELFKYHYTFTSDNYKEISDFLRENYDARLYHDKDKMWKKVKGKLTPEQKERLDIIQVINECLVPNMYALNRENWQTDTKSKANTTTPIEVAKLEKIDEETIKTFKNKDYLSRLGMDKETFEKILRILESENKEEHKRGGRPTTSLSILRRLTATILRRRSNPTYSFRKIAYIYDVEGNQIHKAVCWVDEILMKNGISLEEILI